ncbi:MAG: hypothetical protein KDA81_12705, partial [Planctomycetaceae bacterium]|nr:hypothetical protein [Planctomycetaceae bacterium]
QQETTGTRENAAFQLSSRDSTDARSVAISEKCQKQQRDLSERQRFFSSILFTAIGTALAGKTAPSASRD